MDAMDESFKLLLKISRYNSFLSASCKRKYSTAKLLRQHLEKHDTILLLLFKSNLQQNRNDKTSLRQMYGKEFYHVDYCSFVPWVYDEDLLPNDSPVIQRKKFRLQVLVVHTSTQEHEEAFEKDGDEPGMAPSTNDSKVMKILSAVIQKIRTRPSRTARKNGDDGDEEQADAKMKMRLRKKTTLTWEQR